MLHYNSIKWLKWTMLSIQLNKPLQTANLARLTSLWKEQFRTKPKNLTKTRTDNEKIQTKLQKALKLALTNPPVSSVIGSGRATFGILHQIRVLREPNVLLHLQITFKYFCFPN